MTIEEFREMTKTPLIPNRVTRVTQMTVAASIPSGQFQGYRLTRTVSGRLGWVRVGVQRMVAA